MVLAIICCALWNPQTARADNVVIVIDPGHGGENEGGRTDVYLEKELTLKVAESMKQELEKYQGITVYLTREDDVDMSLEERAQFAQSVNADFLYSIHFNMSAYHELYGTECWISAFGACYAKGNDFAQICNQNLADLGLANRGIKTRLGKKGKDYYGIIRACTANDIPSCIIEHCHMDHEADAPFLDQDTWPQRYGIVDATSVAQYFGLSSQELGVDYSGYEKTRTPIPSQVQRPDATGPDYLAVDSLTRDEENGVIHAVVSARESDSRMMYYAYSTDKGETMTPRLLWPEGAETIVFDIPLPDTKNAQLLIRVLNNYDINTDSELIPIDDIPLLTDAAVLTDASSDSANAPQETQVSGRELLQGLCLAGAALLLLVIVWKIVTRQRKRRQMPLLLVLTGLCILLILAAVLLKRGEDTNRKQIATEKPWSANTEDEKTAFKEEFPSEETLPEDSEKTTEEKNQFYAVPLDEDIKARITGLSYPADTADVQISYDDLCYVHVLHYDFDGNVAEGEIICNQEIAQDLVEIFAELYRQNYPIESIRLVDDYGADDEASMEANNSSCFNYRVIYGTSRLSNHSYGKAIDINPFYNPYVFTRNGEAMVQPKGAETYADRTADNPYAIQQNDLCYQLFTEHGFEWGGSWSHSKDYQHFEKK